MSNVQLSTEDSLRNYQTCKLACNEFEICEHLVNFLLIINSKNINTGGNNEEKKRLLNSELYCLNCKGFFDETSKEPHYLHEVLRQGEEINNTYYVSEVFERIEKLFYKQFSEEEYNLINLKSNFSSEIEKSLQNAYSIFNKLKERKTLEFTEFKRKYDYNYERIKKDVFDLKYKFSQFYKTNEPYFFPKNKVSNISYYNKFDNTITDIIYLINLEFHSKLKDTEQKLQDYIYNEKQKVFGYKAELHKILLDFNAKLQSLFDKSLKNNLFENVIPNCTQGLDISLKKFNQIFEDLNKAYNNINNPDYASNFEEYLTGLENDFLIKYFTKIGDDQLLYKGAAYEKMRLLSSIDGIKVFDCIMNNNNSNINNNKFVHIYNNKNKQSTRKYDWEIDYTKEKEIVEKNLRKNEKKTHNDNSNRNVNTEPTILDYEKKSKVYFFDFLKNPESIIKDKNLKTSKKDSSCNVSINKVINSSKTCSKLPEKSKKLKGQNNNRNKSLIESKIEKKKNKTNNSLPNNKNSMNVSSAKVEQTWGNDNDNSSRYINEELDEDNYDDFEKNFRNSLCDMYNKNGVSRSKSELKFKTPSKSYVDIINNNRGDQLSRNNSELSFGEREEQELNRSAIINNKSLLRNSSCVGFVKQSTALKRSSMDFKRAQENSLQLKVVNNKNKRLSNINHSDDETDIYNINSSSKRLNFNFSKRKSLNNENCDNNNDNNPQFTKAKNKRSASQIIMNNNNAHAQKYFFELNQNCQEENIETENSSKNSNMNLNNINNLSNNYILNINKYPSKACCGKNCSKKPSAMILSQKKALNNNNNNNIKNNSNLESESTQNTKIQVAEKSDKQKFKIATQNVPVKKIINVFRELMEVKELSDFKIYKDKENFLLVKISIEKKLYLLKKFFILQMIEKFGEYDDTNFTQYYTNYRSAAYSKTKKVVVNTISNVNNDYDILLNENHLENLSNNIIPKVKVLTNQILIFNRRNMTMYRNYVPLNYEEHGITFFLEGCRYIVANERIYITGGRDEVKYYNIFLEYDYSNNTVKKLSDMCTPRAYHKMLYSHSKEKMYILGGENNKACELYDFNCRACYPMPNLGEARSHMNAYVTKDGSKLYALFGIKGNSNQSEFSNKVEVLNLDQYESYANNNNLKVNKQLNFTPNKCNNTNSNNKVSDVIIKWENCEVKNFGDLNLNQRYIGVYPLQNDILLLIGGCLYREMNLIIGVYNLKRNEITKIDENILKEIVQKSRYDAVLMKILAEINRNILK